MRLDRIHSFIRPIGVAFMASFTCMFAMLFALIGQQSTKLAMNEKAEIVTRVAAIRTLVLAPFTDVKPSLTATLGVRQPQAVQIAALEVLATFDAPEVPTLVLAVWPELTPRVRVTAAETLLTRAAPLKVLLDAVEKGTVRPTDFDPTRVETLVKMTDEKTRTRAVKLFFATPPSKRQDVLTKYQQALERKGDISKGKALFKETCASCHKLEGVGEAVGTDLSSLKNRAKETLLGDILDPNRVVLPQYYSYVLVTDGDVILTGMISAEAATTVTITKSDGISETVPRASITNLRSTGLSAMPEGFEEKIDLQAMADLLAYLTSVK